MILFFLKKICLVQLCAVQSSLSDMTSFRSSLVLLLIVAGFIIPDVFPKNSSSKMIPRWRTLRRKYLLKTLLFVLLINVLFVSKQRIEKLMTYNLQSVDVVLNHIIGNAYQGNQS